MTVGFHSPLPPARTGVADYSADLLEAMSQQGDVRPGADQADIHLYHLGNNQLHARIYRRALAEPGVVVIHDAVLHHFLLGTLDEQAYIEEFAYNYGSWNRDLARALWQNRARSGADPVYFQYPMLRRVTERARAVVVHNAAAAAMVRAHAPAARIFQIPHLFRPPVLPRAPEVADFRERARAGPGTLLVGVLGHLRESKRISTVLRVWERLRARGADIVLVLAGDFVSQDLERALAPRLSGAGLIRRGYLPEPEFWLTASALDAAINLRYPAAGETSGITIRMMGIGKPVLISTGPEASEFPEHTCLRVDAGPAEEDMLEHYLSWLLAYPANGREIGRLAREHIGALHSPSTVAGLYWEALAETCPGGAGAGETRTAHT